jgi:hypothetical protein
VRPPAVGREVPPVARRRIACVLGRTCVIRQLGWIQDDKKLTYDPVSVRTGRNGYDTRTGAKSIYWWGVDHQSTLYRVAMPYAQFFDGGEALHAIEGTVWSPRGSHGCVNMRSSDAKAYWNLLKNGGDVFVCGRKPGT